VVHIAYASFSQEDNPVLPQCGPSLGTGVESQLGLNLMIGLYANVMLLQKSSQMLTETSRNRLLKQKLQLVSTVRAGLPLI
jgi:hypothetical protein